MNNIKHYMHWISNFNSGEFIYVFFLYFSIQLPLLNWLCLLPILSCTYVHMYMPFTEKFVQCVDENITHNMHCLSNVNCVQYLCKYTPPFSHFSIQLTFTYKHSLCLLPILSCTYVGTFIWTLYTHYLLSLPTSAYEISKIPFLPHLKRVRKTNFFFSF
jgi:hypothetical protein